MYGLGASNIGFLISVDSFIMAAKLYVARNPEFEGYVCCPCRDCKNVRQFSNLEQIRSHLITRGFLEDYKIWNKHGEDGENRAGVDREEVVNEETGVDVDMAEAVNDVFRNTLADDTVEDGLSQMLRDAEPGFLSPRHLEKLEKMRKDAKVPLYPGCKVSKLEADLMLLDLKSSHGLSDQGFEDMLCVLEKLLPSPNELPRTTYEAKQMICPLDLEVEKIHACTNDCILYRGDEYKDLDACPKCEAPRYKYGTAGDDGSRTKGGPVKVAWYFPIFLRVERLFANANTAKLMRWHKEGRRKDKMLRHPADGSDWRTINTMFKRKFDYDPRNIRFGLSTDGMNPFDMVRTNHSTWPVMLCIYNLPPWLCMKRAYIMLAVMIQGPK